MSLIGLKKKSPLCKICLSFDEKILNEITLDIMLGRRTYKGIREKYSPLLPPGIAKLNDMNINNHRKHSDPEVIADDVLKRRGKSNDAGEVISQLYSERFKEKINKQRVLVETYRERLNNLSVLQGFLNDKRDELDMLKESPPTGTTAFSLNRKENEIRDLVINIDKILESLQSVVIKETNSDKGIGEGSVHITQNFVNVFQTHLKGFMDEIVPHILLEFFGDNPKQGESLIKYISRSMDKHLIPALNESQSSSDSQSKIN